MHQIQIQRKKKIYNRVLPAHWQECTQSQKLEAIKVLLTYNPITTKVVLLRSWLQLPKHVFNLLDEDYIFALVDCCLDWLQLEPNATPIFDSFTHKAVTYYLPMPKFQNTTAFEYPICDEYLQKFIQKGDEMALISLIAAICREAKTSQIEIDKTGDKRVTLQSRQEIAVRAEKLKDLPSEIKMSVLLYFAGCRAFIHRIYGEHLFENKETEEGEDSGNTDKGNGSDFGWWGLYMDVAESRVFGDYEKVLQTNFHTICAYLVKKRKDYIRLQQENNFRHAAAD